MLDRQGLELLGAMIPQERRLEGLSVYSYFNYPFCLREGIDYMSFLGKAKRFLISP
jgi:hypothetical protein